MYVKFGLRHTAGWDGMNTLYSQKVFKLTATTDYTIVIALVCHNGIELDQTILISKINTLFRS
jgi:hypothetical protein